MKFDGERLAGVTSFVQEEGGAGGEAAQGVGKTRANGASVIEGENPIVLGDGEQFLHGARKSEKRSSRGIDEGADHAGGGGLAAGGRPVENENGMRADGVKSGEKPGGEAGAVGVSREVEGGWQKAGGRRQRARGRWQKAGGRRQRAGCRRQKAGGRWQKAGCSGTGELGVASTVEEGGSWVGGDLPAGGCDFDDFAVGVVEIEKNGVGLAGVAAYGDTSMNGKARSA